MAPVTQDCLDEDEKSFDATFVALYAEELFTPLLLLLLAFPTADENLNPRNHLARQRGQSTSFIGAGLSSVANRSDLFLLLPPNLAYP